MSVHDAKPGDLYVDAGGKLWRVVHICGEPTVCVEEVEKAAPESPVRKSGGISGLMWNGFKRIHRPEISDEPTFKILLCETRVQTPDHQR